MLNKKLEEIFEGAFEFDTQEGGLWGLPKNRTLYTDEEVAEVEAVRDAMYAHFKDDVPEYAEWSRDLINNLYHLKGQNK